MKSNALLVVGILAAAFLGGLAGHWLLSPAQTRPAEATGPGGEAGTGAVSLKVHEGDLRTSYANAFRANGTAEEVILDFGINLVRSAREQGGQPEIRFDVTDRIILNYYSTKRLAMTLSQLIRKHEDQFGELQLDVSKRQIRR